MKCVSLPLSALALVAGGALFLAPSNAAAVNVDVRIGTAPPPPPVVVDRAWARPYRGAVWIEPHYEWTGRRWIWVRGWYAYPPRPGMIWIGPRYHHGYYRAGYWSY